MVRLTEDYYSAPIYESNYDPESEPWYSPAPPIPLDPGIANWSPTPNYDWAPTPSYDFGPEPLDPWMANWQPPMYDLSQPPPDWTPPEPSYGLSIDAPSAFDFSGGWQSRDYGNLADNPDAPVYEMGAYGNVDPTGSVFRTPQSRFEYESQQYQDTQDNNWWDPIKDWWDYQRGDNRGAAPDRGGFAETVFGAGEANRRGIFGPESDEWNPVLRELSQAAVDPLSYVGFTAAPALGGMGRAGGIAAELLAPSFQGGGAASRIGGEIAVNAAANWLGREAVAETAERTDNPWLIGAAGLLGGVVGGVGTYGGLKGLDTVGPGIFNPPEGSLLASEAGAINFKRTTNQPGLYDPVRRALVTLTPEQEARRQFLQDKGRKWLEYEGSDEDLWLKDVRPVGPEKEYIRYGQLPESGRSHNFKDNRAEIGISVYAAQKTPTGYAYDDSGGIDSLSRAYIADQKPFLVRGREVGVGSDGEPLIVDARVVGSLNARADGTFAVPATLRSILASEAGAIDFTPTPRPDESIIPNQPGITTRVPPPKTEPMLPDYTGSIVVTAPNAEGYMGNLIKLPAKLSDDAVPADVIKVMQDGDRARNGAAIVLQAEAAPAWKVLKDDLFKGKDGNIYMKNVLPSPAEQEAGLPGALFERVIERPTEYVLSPDQMTAIRQVDLVASKSVTEREVFGIPVNKLSLEDDEVHGFRLVTKVPEGDLTQGGSKRVGRSLSKDAPRIFDDPATAAGLGYRYADPEIAFNAAIARNLQKALDNHVKTLLDPFAQTPAKRVSQELRALVEGVSRRGNNLQKRLETAERQQSAVVKQYKWTEAQRRAVETRMEPLAARIDAIGPENGPELSHLSGQFYELRLRAERLRALSAGTPKKPGAGAKVVSAGENVDTLLRDLNKAQMEAQQLAKRWHGEIQSSRTPPPGRRTLRGGPDFLIGRDFDVNTAARLEAYYGRGVRIGDLPLPEKMNAKLGNRAIGTNVPGIRQLNSVLTPANSIGDLSVTLNQLANQATRHPIRFAQQFALAARDMVDDAHYFKWEAENGGDAAAHGVALMGGAMRQTDYEFGSWIERIPGLSQTQKQFQRMSNRMRVEGYNAARDTAVKSGRAMSDDELTQLGRGLNRITGVSNSRATDIEGIVQFAPNFLRSQIENIVYAVSKGGIEGKLAREYLGTWIGVGSAATVGIAMMQGRDWKEVAQPFNTDTGPSWLPQWSKIRVNPNFATIRLGGLDINVFGAYDSLARLSIIAADAVNQSIRQQDALQLFDAIGYGASTKGSPFVKFFTDLIKGETFTGESPTSASTMLQRVIPFTAQTAIQAHGEGFSPVEVAKQTAIGAFGQKSNPVTVTEALDLIAGGRFYDKTKEEQAAILAAHPDLAKRKATYDANRLEQSERKLSEEDIARARKTAGFALVDKMDIEKEQQYAAAVTEYRIALETADTDRERGDAGAKLRQSIGVIDAAMANQKLGVERLTPGMYGTTKDPVKLAVNEYYETFSRASEAGPLDFDRQQTYLRELEQKYAGNTAALKAIHDAENRLRTSPIPEVDAMFQAQKAIRDSGYWDAENKTEFRKEHAAVADMVKTYGYSPLSVRSEELTAEYGARQSQLDVLLNARSGPSLTPKEWRDARGALVEEKRAKIEELFSGLPNTDMAKGGPVDKYFAQIDEHKDPVTGKPDWDRVDAWLVKQPPEVQAAVDNALMLNKTATEKAYRADVKQIADAGYWDVHDQVWKEYSKLVRVPAYVNEDQYWDGYRQSLVVEAEQLLDRSKPYWRATMPDAANQVANVEWEKAYGKFSGYVTEENRRWRAYHPSEASLLRKWEYAGQGAKEVYGSLAGIP